jgi:ribosomal protein S18 acetylase RimI-like enzyme
MITLPKMEHTNPHIIELTFAQTEKEIDEILALQQLNLKINVSEEIKKDQGFLTVCHTKEQLVLMQSQTPQIIAKHNDKVVAFALAMLSSMGKLTPELQPMFDIVEGIVWRGRSIAGYKYYIMGQICVAEEFRSQGIFEKLYQTHKNIYEKEYDLCITEISTSNKRSQRAHERVGFTTIHQHQDLVDAWNVVAWELKAGGMP